MVPAACVSGNEPLQIALDLMAERQYDQVPITQGKGGPLIGVISYRLMREDRVSYQYGPAPGQPSRSSMRNLLQLLEDGMVREGGHESIDTELMRYYYKNDFIIVVDSEERVEGIAQLWDIANGLLPPRDR